jgi:hypothetical protein
MPVRAEVETQGKVPKPDSTLKWPSSLRTASRGKRGRIPIGLGHFAQETAKPPRILPSGMGLDKRRFF